mmetsp:Transcript_19297/g.45084  ORF Transcript_19297/g.45084 Transcript_19297/m.45084 type:complete len:508 (-) Transcript_19297:147-1670(-)
MKARQGTAELAPVPSAHVPRAPELSPAAAPPINAKSRKAREADAPIIEFRSRAVLPRHHPCWQAHTALRCPARDMADAVVARTLFRALKRVVQDFDRNVALRALLTAVPQRVYHRERRRVIEINSSLLANSVLERVIREVNEGADFYRPAKQLRPSLALETLRRHFREPMLPVRQSDSQSDNELDKVRRAQETMHANPLDAGFEALRWLSSMRASFNELPVGDWRPVRIPAFELAPEQSSMPRIGDVLLTHPVSCPRQPTLHQAAILLCEGGQFGYGGSGGNAAGSEGVMGIVLNRPSRLTLGQLLAASQDVTNILLAPFRDNVVYVGGDVMREGLLMLHPFGDVAESTQICEGVYVSSDLQALNDAIVCGKDPHRFKIFVGHCGWAKEQLALECARGVWFTTRGSAEAVAQISVGSHCFLDGENLDATLAPIAHPKGGTSMAPQYLTSADRSLYCALLSGLSVEHRVLTLLACDPEVLLEHLHATVERHLDGVHAALERLPPDDGA